MFDTILILKIEVNVCGVVPGRKTNEVNIRKMNLPLLPLIAEHLPSGFYLFFFRIFLCLL